MWESFTRLYHRLSLLNYSHNGQMILDRLPQGVLVWGLQSPDFSLVPIDNKEHTDSALFPVVDDGEWLATAIV